MQLKTSANSPPAPLEPARATGEFVSAPVYSSVRALVLFYRAVSRFFKPSSCRFYPTCSEYLLEALQRHGAGKGLWMGVRRVLRCHPFHPGGYDPA